MESHDSSSPSLHIAMYPWLAFGHITQFLHLSNKLAEKGHKISFLVPAKIQPKLQSFNKFPNLITFVPLTIPHVENLPPGTETTADVAYDLVPLIATAMDLTEPQVETILCGLKPDIVFFDLAHWVPKLSRKLGFKTVYFSTMSPVFVAYMSGYILTEPPSEEMLLEPPPGFPDRSIKLRRHEVPYFGGTDTEAFGSDGISYPNRIFISSTESDVYVSKGCREIDGPFVKYIEKLFRREIWLAGPILPEPASAEVLDLKWEGFLSKFERGSVVYCAFGSEARLSRGQFQELVSGLELSGHPFLAALKPPIGAETVEDALPEGFSGERGVVFGGWIQQHRILAHPAVGCFITHMGYGSMMEGIVEGCQLVMVSFAVDQSFNAKVIATRLRAGVEVDRNQDDGSFTRDGINKAIQTAVSDDGGREIRANLANLRELLIRDGLESSYINDFNLKLQALVVN